MVRTSCRQTAMLPWPSLWGADVDGYIPPHLLQSLQTSARCRAPSDERIADPFISPDPEKNVDIVVAFAKWSHPVHPGETYIEPPWRWPEGTELDTLGAWTAKAAEAERRSIGDAPCYRMSPCQGHSPPVLLVRIFHREPAC